MFPCHANNVRLLHPGFRTGTRPPSDPSNSTKIFPSQSITLSPILRLRKSFNCNTYAALRKCSKQKTYGMAKSFSFNTYKKHGVPTSSQKLFSFFFPVLSSTPLGASEPLWLPLRLPSSVPSSKFRILQLLCLQLIQKHRGCGGILPISALIARPSALIARSSSELFQQHTCGGGGTLIPYFITSLLPYLAASSSHESLVTIRSIIPPREHPSERSRMPGPGLPHRKRNHHSRILSTCPERPRQRLQPEIEPRSDHDARRSTRPQT